MAAKKTLEEKVVPLFEEIKDTYDILLKNIRSSFDAELTDEIKRSIKRLIKFKTTKWETLCFDKKYFDTLNTDKNNLNKQSIDYLDKLEKVNAKLINSLEDLKSHIEQLKHDVIKNNEELQEYRYVSELRLSFIFEQFSDIVSLDNKIINLIKHNLNTIQEFKNSLSIKKTNA